MGAINDPDFYNHLVQTYETILNRAPNAQVYVADYPYLATEDSDVCGQTDLTGAWAVQGQLNAVIADAVEQVAVGSSRIHYVDTNKPGSPFAGKHLCNGGESDFNGLVAPPNTAYSFHPSAAGQEDYATMFADAIS